MSVPANFLLIQLFFCAELLYGTMGHAIIDTARRARDFRSRSANLKKVIKYSNNINCFKINLAVDFYKWKLLLYFINLLIRTARPEIARVARRIDYSVPLCTV